MSAEVPLDRRDMMASRIHPLLATLIWIKPEGSMGRDTGSASRLPVVACWRKSSGHGHSGNE
jgi:hypothetical protein